MLCSVSDMSHRKGGNEALRHSPEGCLVRSETCSDPMPNWPDEGRVEVVDVVMRYRADLSPSLAGISLVLEAGDKVRTNS